MLRFDGRWRFDSPGKIARGVETEFSRFIGKTASQGDRQDILEHFKNYFAEAAGTTTARSSSASWAQTDLDSYMTDAARNAPLFIEAFYDACVSLRKSHPEYVVPDVGMINRVLSKCKAGYQIHPPNLVASDTHHVIEAPDQEIKTLDQQARDLVHESLKQSEQLMTEERYRQAVQEIVWLLETVSTAFRGLKTNTGTIQGKYFNKIAEDLRKQQRGSTLGMVLEWITALHGYLSSPTGGGIRHGQDLSARVEIRPNEARLFCNLIRSYVTYLLAEHSRLSKP